MDGKPNLAKDAWQSDVDNGSNEPFAPTPKPDATSSWTHEVLSGSDAGADNKRQFSVLGQTLVFKGELTAEEDILIQGRVEGTITHNGNTLTIGPQGNVKANVDPRPTSLCTQICPPCSSTNFLASVRPSPVPSCLRASSRPT